MAKILSTSLILLAIIAITYGRSTGYKVDQLEFTNEAKTYERKDEAGFEACLHCIFLIFISILILIYLSFFFLINLQNHHFLHQKFRHSWLMTILYNAVFSCRLSLVFVVEDAYIHAKALRLNGFKFLC